ncbi:hypothetical protein [Ferruginibacter sp. HRS2-29]|uniref:hypothetical protein n=1 Tax=Ferruginibacter sp. HRS2-29 TaxID=2487334 RepID=UPI0020CEE7B9|nr:hypothetical protein [Ferruginibacter sp. HRS2-29]MCP9752979.1 hypothetical protein [Ferruginibacter sp. HRS2-29]
MTQTYIYAGVALVIGFALAWIIQLVKITKIKKEHKSMQGFLESERLMKETLQKENIQVHQLKQATELELHRKLKEAVQLTKMMDADILLLQKSNEETEAQLASAQPELHAIKLKLIEANNTIARYKAQLGIK